MADTFSGKKILIVEDDQDTRLGLNMRLRSWGFDTTFAADAVSATSAARDGQPDLVLLDLGLPGGDGFLVMERLKQLPATACIPVVVLTARTPHENLKKALAGGARSYLQKPVDDYVLQTTLLRALDAESAWQDATSMKLSRRRKRPS